MAHVVFAPIDTSCASVNHCLITSLMKCSTRLTVNHELNECRSLVLRYIFVINLSHNRREFHRRIELW